MMDANTADRIAAIRARAGQKPHGTRARYMVGCKCMLCRSAHSNYNRLSDERVRSGVRNDLVSVQAVRDHLAQLSKSGVGYKAVADAASVSRTVLLKVRNGKRLHMRRQNAERVLAVDLQAISDGALVAAGPTWKILDELLREGYSKRQLANWLGCARTIQYSRDQIKASSAARVEKMARALEAGKLRRDR